MIALTQEHTQIIEFHQLLQNKLFLENIQSCKTKEELNYYVKPKDRLEALHDNFIKYGTKNATSFIIIDVDNVNSSLEEYTKEVHYKLQEIKPNWISKTDKGFHIGFILNKPLWLNNSEEVKKAEQTKRDLTILLDGDIAGSHRLLGYWRNPLTHKSELNTETIELNSLSKIAQQQYLESFSLFDDISIHNTKKEKRQKNKTEIAKSNWEQINLKGFTQGNRNNFLFNKIIGMLYNGIITNDEVLSTLKTINNNILSNKEIQKIAKSIIKYNIKPISKKTNEKRIKGIYSKDLWENNIHNYKDKNKVQFERQRIGQKISTAKIIEKTIYKLISGYVKTYQNKERFINKNLEKNCKVKKRTIQRYRNNRLIEDKIKGEAFKRYLKGLAPQGVMAKDIPIRNIVNLIIETLDYYYPKTNKLFKFKINEYHRLIFYEYIHSNKPLAA